MRLKTKNGELFIENRAYQARNGAVYLDWGNTVIKLDKDYADSILYDIPDFDLDAYKSYYVESLQINN